MNQITLRRIGLALAGLVLAILAVLTAVRFYHARQLHQAAERFEHAVGPLDFAQYQTAPVAAADNAALPILQAADRLPRPPEGGTAEGALGPADLMVLNRRSAADWNEEDRQRVRALLADRQSELALLDQAAGRPGSSFDLDYAAGLKMEIPDLRAILWGADLLFARARLAWADGRPDAAAGSIEALDTISRALEREAPLIFQLVGQAVEVLEYRAIQEGLAAAALSADDLHRLRPLAEPRPRMDQLRRALGAEGTTVYHARPGSPEARELTGEPPWTRRFTYYWVGDGSIARVLDYFTQVADVFPALTYPQLADGRTAPPRPQGMPADLVVDVPRVGGSFKATAALGRVTRVALDLSLAGAADGALPAALPSAPDTARGHFAGNALTYRLADDGSATLTLPGADALWRQVKAGREGIEHEPPLFTWTLRVTPEGAAGSAG